MKRPQIGKFVGLLVGIANMAVGLFILPALNLLGAFMPWWLAFTPAIIAAIVLILAALEPVSIRIDAMIRSRRCRIKKSCEITSGPDELEKPKPIIKPDGKAGK